MTFSLALGLASALALFTALVHATLGAPEILRPVLDAPLPRVVRHVIEVVWHALTWHFVILGAAFAWAAFRPDAAGAPVVAVLGAATTLGYAALFLGLALARFGNPWRMPQWTLFLPMGLLAGVGPWLDKASAPLVGDVAAIVAAGVLAALGLLHAVWAAGLPWPLSDRTALALTVVGEPGDRMPGRLATVAIAVLLTFAAAWVLSLRGLLVPSPPDGFVRAALTWGMVGVFAVRGLGGFFEGALRPAIVGTPYQRWSLRLYSPLSAALAAAVGLAAS